jgi:hypothetical protein
MRLADVIGGHLVSGHVDGVGEVLRFDPVGDNRLLEIRAPKEIAKFIARKGSITVNGTSLTTNEVKGTDFTINLIPHTLENTTLNLLKPGSKVNLEIDLMHGCNSGNLEAFWTGVRFPSPPPKGIGSAFRWGCTGFDRAGKGEQATRQAIDVNEANP